MVKESFRETAIPTLGCIAVDVVGANHRNSYTRSVSRPLQLLTPRRLLPRMILSIFVAEFFIMFLLATLPPLSLTVEAVIDSAALLILLSPTFYYFHYRPLLQYHVELKKVIDRLSLSEERLTLTLGAVNDGLCDWDIPSRHVYLSERAQAIMGYGRNELDHDVGKLRDLVHLEDRDFVNKKLVQHFQNKSHYYETEHRLQKKDGEYIWVLARGRVVARDKNGRAMRMVGTYTDITKRKLIEAALRKSEEDIRALTQRLLSSSEEEKKHLAQDLHDEFGQVLTAFQLGVEMLRSHNYNDEEDFQFHCTRLLKMVDTLEVDLRHICDHLRPIMLDDVGLIATLHWYIKEFEMIDRSVKVDFQVHGTEPYLSREVNIALYRIFQESLNNVVKHADASHVAIELFFGPDKVSLTIEDNGHGFRLNTNNSVKMRSSGFGLLGMRERAMAVKGDLQTTSCSHGVTIKVEIPLKGVLS
jgi:two-component system, NarL family, sensor histidine kinase UhpB